MSAWQAQNGYEPTGILTAARAGRAARRLQRHPRRPGHGDRARRGGGHRDRAAHAASSPRRSTEPPFVRYDAADGSLAAGRPRSRSPGDQSRLSGLYEIMQTLEVVPAGGPARADRGGLRDRGPGRAASTRPPTPGWWTGRSRASRWSGPRATRTGARASWRRCGRASGACPACSTPPRATRARIRRVDLVSGLQVRQPRADRLGLLRGRARAPWSRPPRPWTECARGHARRGDPGARRRRPTPALNLAVLQPRGGRWRPARSPPSGPTAPRIGAEVAVAGFPYGGALARPALTFGTLADVRGLNGEEEVRRLDLAAQAGRRRRAGARRDGRGDRDAAAARGRRQVLPEEVSYALDAETIQARAGAGRRHGPRSHGHRRLGRRAADARRRRPWRCW